MKTSKQSQEDKDKKIVHDAILKQSWQDTQGGDVSYQGKGKWSFVSRGLNFTPAQINALHRLVGYEPKVIIPKGSCKDCIFSRNGRERGYEAPCGGCNRPVMSNFKPRKK